MFSGGGGVHKKTIYRGGLPKKRGRLGLFADLRVGLAKKRGLGVFEGGSIHTPMHTIIINTHVNIQIISNVNKK